MSDEVVNPRTCIECHHWYFDSGYPRYSELTPGSSGYTGCLKGKWPIPYRRTILGGTYMMLYDLDRDQFARYLRTAESCADFSDRAKATTSSAAEGQKP